MSLAEDLPKEIKRVTEIIHEYRQVPGNAGLLAASLMQLDIDRAIKASVAGDVTEMLLCYSKLKEWEL